MSDVPDNQKTAESPRPVRRSFWRRWMRRLAIGFGAVLLLLVGIYALRGPLLAEPLGELAGDQLSDALGGRFRIARIEGNWYETLEIVGLETLEEPNTGPVRVLTAPRVTLRYALGDLLGARPAEALKGLVARDLVVDLDLTRPAAAPTEDVPASEPLDIPALLDQIPRSGPGLDLSGTVSLKTAPTDRAGFAFELGTAETEAEGGYVLHLRDVVLPAALDLPAAADMSFALDRPESEAWRLRALEAPFDLAATARLDRPAAAKDTVALDAELHLEALATVTDLEIDVPRLSLEPEQVGARARIRASLGDGELHRFLERYLPPEAPRLAAGALAIDLEARALPLEEALDAFRLTTDLKGLALAAPAAPSAIDFRPVRDIDLNIETQLATPGSRAASVEFDFRGLGATARLRGLTIDVTGEEPVLAGLDELSVALRDLGGRARALLPELAEHPWPADVIDADLKIRVSEGDPRREPLELEAVAIRCGEARAGITGRIQLPAELADFAPTTLDLRTDGAIPALAPLLAALELPAEIRGAIDWTGSVSGRVDAPVATVTARLREGRLDDYDLGAGDFAFTFAEQVIDLQRLALEGGIARIDGAGRVDLETAAIDGGRLRVSVPDLAPLRSLAPDAPPVEAALSLDAEVTKSAGPWTGGWTATAEGRAEGLRVQNEDLGRADFSFAMNDTRAELRRLGLSGPAGRINAAGTVDLAMDPPAIDLNTLNGEALDLARLARLAPPAEDASAGPATIIAGRLDFSGRARKDGGLPWDRFAFDGGVTLRDLGVDEQAIGDLDLTLTAADRVIQLNPLRAQGPWGDVRLAARAELEESGAGSAQLSELAGTVDGYPLRQNSPAQVTWSATGSLLAESLDLELLGGRLRGRFAHDEFIDAELRGIDFDLAKLPALKTTGVVDLDLTVQGLLERPNLALRLGARDLTHDGISGLGAQFSLTQDADSLRIDELTAGAPGLEIRGGGQLPLSLGSAGAELLPWSEGDFGLQLALSGNDALPDGTTTLVKQLADRFALPSDYGFERVGVDLGLRGGRISSTAEVVGPRAGEDFASIVPARIDLGLEADAESSRITLGAPPTGGFRFAGEGRVEAGIGSRLADDPALPFRSAPLTFDLDVHADDLAPFAAAAPDIVRLAGSLDAKLGVRGRTDAPQPRVRVEVNELAARTDSDLPSLTHGRVRLALDDRRLSLEEVRGELGHAPIAVGGTIDFDAGWDAPRFDLEVDGENTLLARNEDLRLRADLDLDVDGPLDRLELGGKVTVTDALFTKPITLEGSSQPTADDRFQIFSLRRPPLSNIQFDLDILADRTIRIDNNLASGLAAADLHLIGDGAVPKPEGRIDFAGLRVILPFSKLRLERGSVIFDAADPFSPRLAINGNTRMRGYDLSVNVSGRLPDQRVLVQADPFLPQEDALLLLSVGATRQGLQDEGLGRAALTRAGSMLGDSLIGELFGPGDPEEESLADRFSVEIGRDVSRSGASTLEVEYRALKKLFLRAERDRYDDYNFDLVWRLRFR